MENFVTTVTALFFFRPHPTGVVAGHRQGVAQFLLLLVVRQGVGNISSGPFWLRSAVMECYSQMDVPLLGYRGSSKRSSLVVIASLSSM